MNALKSLYLLLANHMVVFVIGAMVLVFGLAAALSAEAMEALLLPAWGIVTILSLFLGLGDHVFGWISEVKDA